jgi:ribulose-5-phosphate 4-epimerase/fuculose-1-phosphate aldolase
MAEVEGVIKFDYAFDETDEVVPIDEQILLWRQMLFQYDLVGEVPDRYGGFGFGNISYRLPQGFAITASQTGRAAILEAQHFALVTDWSLERNWLRAEGAMRPSSESLTHAAIYEANASIQAVFHVHSPTLWGAQEMLCLPETAASIPYGTVEMAATLKALTRRLGAEGLIRMAGHEDGIVAWSTSPLGAGARLLKALSDVP